MPPSRKNKTTTLVIDWPTARPRSGGQLLSSNSTTPTKTSISQRPTPASPYNAKVSIGEVRFLREKVDIAERLHSRLQCLETAQGHPAIVLSEPDEYGMVDIVVCTTKPSKQRGYAKWQRLNRKIIPVYNKDDSAKFIYTREHPYLDFVGGRHFDRSTNLTLEMYKVPEAALSLWRDGNAGSEWKPLRLTEESVQLLQTMLSEAERSEGLHWSWSWERSMRKKNRDQEHNNTARRRARTESPIRWRIDQSKRHHSL